ncbi:MAG: porin [Zoogloeaceae bacterium]|nr:porin [Zoogloeaceae bacterium]
MQKKLIALAVAGLVSAPAFAQSNVQIYGVVDAGVVRGKADNNKFNGVQSGLLSASRIGFRGTEDLGNGLKAVFTLEYGINTDTGDGITGARQSFVGLQGGFGFVGLGRQYSPGHNISGLMDPFGGSAAYSPYTLLSTAAGSSIVNGGNGRINNSISYKSPTMGGFALEAMYAFGENADQDDSDNNRDLGNLFGIGGSYKNGPLRAGVVYHRAEGGGGAGLVPVETDDTREWMVGAGYDFGVVDLSVTYLDVKDPGARNAANAANTDKSKLWTANAAIPVSASGKVLLGYGSLKLERAGALSDQKVKSWTVAYTHSLSKRTTAYAGYRNVSNDDVTTTTAVPGLSTPVDESSRGFSVGVRHTF